MNPNASGRTATPETVQRPAPGRSAEPRGPEVRGPEVRGPEMRGPEVRAAEVRAPEASPRASILGPTLRFRGELSAQEDLMVQGSVEGSITHTQTLTIGTDGSMKGDIRARVIIIDGKVDGNLYATESISIRATAKVKGNVFAPRIGIADGAFFHGQIDMQASGAAVQAHSARLREPVPSQPLDPVTVDKVLSAG